MIELEFYSWVEAVFVKLQRSAHLEVHDQYVDEYLFTGLDMNKFDWL